MPDQNNKIVKNILPYDGQALYFGKVFSDAEINHYYKALFHNINWKNDEAKIFGKHYITKRKVAWYALKPFTYSYSGFQKTAIPFTKELMDLKQICENVSQEKYNSCLLNLYHDGNEGMAWHSDGEKELVDNAAIASLSFGAERKFSFKHKSSKEKIDVSLENGSLLIMAGECQKNWLHRLPATKKVHSPRINLTFRLMNGKT